MSETPPDSLKDRRRFAGTLSLGDRSIDVSFGCHVDPHGVVQLQLDDVALNDRTKFILSTWYDDKELAYYDLVGTSEDGVRFASQHLSFDSIGPDTDERGSRYVFQARTALAEFVRPMPRPEPTKLFLFLCGFASFGKLSASCRLGEVVAGGKHDAEADLLSGTLGIIAPKEVEDVQRWRKDAAELLEHVRAVISFGAGANLIDRVTEFRSGHEIVATVRSSTIQHAADMPVFHFIDRQGLLEAAVRSFFESRVGAKDIRMACEWFGMCSASVEM